jgi:hypothetical protein
MNMYKLLGWIINRIRKQVTKLILIHVDMCKLTILSVCTLFIIFLQLFHLLPLLNISECDNKSDNLSQGKNMSAHGLLIQ